VLRRHVCALDATKQSPAFRNPAELLLEKEIERRKEIDNRAQGILINSVSDAFLDDIVDLDSAKKIADKLEALCGTYGVVEMAGFFKEFALGVKEDNQTVQEYCGVVQDYCNKTQK